ncbi:MAG: fibrobacter succinogenes major paralogous domain-containing protein [Sphaerochaetaceae bacterium]
MKRKQRIVLFGIVAFALIFAACGGDSGNNSTETDGNSSSSAEIYSSGEQGNSSPVVKSSSSSVTLSSSTANSSSSSIVVSSSNAKAQSSSSVTAGVVDPSTVISGTMTDSRDGQSYKTVTIGTQTWMAENLNYKVDSSWCYENRADSCAKYGRLYTWTGAMNIDTSYQYASATAVISTPHQGVCPAGWHIPTDAEWTTLENAVGGEDTAGTKLKSTSGWNDDGDEGGNGTDAYGFSALPAGSHYGYGNFNLVGNHADFWSATEYDTDRAYRRHLYYFSADMGTNSDNKYYAFSVRCLKD